jgi:hypothetical protein
LRSPAPRRLASIAVDAGEVCASAVAVKAAIVTPMIEIIPAVLFMEASPVRARLLSPGAVVV